MIPVFIGLGSNVGDRRGYLALAIYLLGKIPRSRVEKVSSVYRVEAMTLDDQPGPEFLNAACLIQTNLLPRELLKHLKLIESQLGRSRYERWAPRTIDLDILDYGGQPIHQNGLTVPHPEMTRRAFVLRPLAEIAPHWRHPTSGESALKLLEALEDSPHLGKVLACCGSFS